MLEAMPPNTSCRTLSWVIGNTPITKGMLSSRCYMHHGPFKKKSKNTYTDPCGVGDHDVT